MIFVDFRQNIADLKINKEILQPTPSKSKGESSDAQPLPPQKKNEPSVGSGGDLDKNSEEPLVKKQKGWLETLRDIFTCIAVCVYM